MQINKLDKCLLDIKDNNISKEVKNIKSIILLIITCCLMKHFIEFINSNTTPGFLFKEIESKFRIYSKFGNIFDTSENILDYNCGHFFKQELSFIFLRVVNVLNKESFGSYTPKMHTLTLESLNNYLHNNNDIILILYSFHLRKFSNVLDREMRFTNFYQENLTLKHALYFLYCVIF